MAEQQRIFVGGLGLPRLGTPFTPAAPLAGLCAARAAVGCSLCPSPRPPAQVRTGEVLFSQGIGARGQGLQFGWLSNDRIRFSFWNDTGRAPPRDPPRPTTRHAGAAPASVRAQHAALVIRSECHAVGEPGPGPAAVDASWHHWAVTYAGTRGGTPWNRLGRVYRDGELVAQCRKPFDYSGTGFDSGRFWVARPLLHDFSGDEPVGVASTEAAYNPLYDKAANFKGRMAEIRIWAGVALSQHRIRTYMHMTGATVLSWHPDALFLTAYWQLSGFTLGLAEANEAPGASGSSSELPDATGNGHNATMWFGPRLTPGLEIDTVAVADIRQSLDMDELQAAARAQLTPGSTERSRLYTYVVAPTPGRRRAAVAVGELFRRAWAWALADGGRRGSWEMGNDEGGEGKQHKMILTQMKD